MATIHFHTNLDETKHIVSALHKTWNGPVPSIGSEINFKQPFPFTLRVCSVMFDEDGNAMVHLHIPPLHYGNSIQDFMDWWKRRKDQDHCENVVHSFKTQAEFDKYCAGILGVGIVSLPFWTVEAWKKYQRQKKFREDCEQEGIDLE